MVMIETKKLRDTAPEITDRSATAFLMQALADLAKWKYPDDPSGAYGRFIAGPYQEFLASPAVDPEARHDELLIAQDKLRLERHRSKKAALGEEYRILVFQTMALFCACAQNALKDRRERLAWNYLLFVWHIRAAILSVESFGGPYGPKLASTIARSGANAKNEDNRELKIYALEWFEANKSTFNTLEAAAQAIAGKVVAMKYRTVRSWLVGKKLK